MGITFDTINFFHKALNFLGYSDWKKLRICEFGNQRIRNNCVPFRTGKKYFESLGAEHTSIDLNGKDGALKYDLSGPVPVMGPFDMVTNYGTIEHVAKSQYWPFRNMHDLTREEGVMVHAMPMVGNWKGHGDYHYSKDVIESLAKYNNYEICFLKVLKRPEERNVLIAILKKRTDEAFISELVFNKYIGGIYK